MSERSATSCSEPRISIGIAGGLLPAGASVTDNLGRTLTGVDGRPNPELCDPSQLAERCQLRLQRAAGLSEEADGSRAVVQRGYTYSHSIDEGSTWHSGATTASGGAGGDGYSTDQAIPGLDRGNSVFDIRQRLVLNYVYELPGKNLHGFAGAALGRLAVQWNLGNAERGPLVAVYFNGSQAWSRLADPTVTLAPRATSLLGNAQTLAATTIWMAARTIARAAASPSSALSRQHLGKRLVSDRCELRRDHQRMRRICESGESAGHLRTLPGMCGHLGRNQFQGPGQITADMTLGKTFNFTERVHMKFEWQAFNVFNHANFLLATTGGRREQPRHIQQLRPSGRNAQRS